VHEVEGRCEGRAVGQAGGDVEHGADAAERCGEEQQLGDADLAESKRMLVVILGAAYVAGQARHVGAERGESKFECKFLAGGVGLYGGEGSQGLDGRGNGLERCKYQILIPHSSSCLQQYNDTWGDGGCSASDSSATGSGEPMAMICSRVHSSGTRVISGSSWATKAAAVAEEKSLKQTPGLTRPALPLRWRAAAADTQQSWGG
jgi:hypothetical protein